MSARRSWRGAFVRVLLLLGGLALLVVLVGCKDNQQAQVGSPDATSASSEASGSSYTTLVDDFRNTDLGNGWTPVASTELTYARCFTIDRYDGGYQLACLADSARYLVVPEDKPVPEGLSSDITVLRQPLDHIYLAASDTMCLFDALDALSAISVSGIERDAWSISSAREAMDRGSIIYGGKYRSPDYELLVSDGVRLAIESTMINHTPEVREKLKELGIGVLCEFSSYENEPLGRAEWIKLYGVLLGHEDAAEAIYQKQLDQVASMREPESGKTVAFFYLNSSGAAVVRRPGDYVTKMIEQAGGTYAFDDLEGAKAGSSSMTIQMESFYAAARDADVLIYNSSIDGGVSTLDDLFERSDLFRDFKAVQTGDVWVTDQNMYQQMLRSGDIIRDINGVLCGSTDNLTFLERLS